jgi:hypothetical protein
MRMGAVSTPLAIRFNIIFIGATTFDRRTLRRIGIREIDRHQDGASKSNTNHNGIGKVDAKMNGILQNDI